MRPRHLSLALATVLAGAMTLPVMAQTPKKGGILNFAVVAELPTSDCHAATTFAMVHPVAPQYSTLLKFDGPHDNNKIVGDLAESWEVSKDGLTYTFKLRKDVKFHDGSDFTSADIKATYDRIRNPPDGVVSARKALHQAIDTIETPDAHTVIFKLKVVDMSLQLQFASPFNCVYSAAALAKDQQYPAKKPMGTGAFEFVEYVKGSHWVGKRFDKYFLKDRPYLDGFKAYIVKGTAVVSGIQGGQFDAEFRGRSPAERDQLVSAMKDNLVVVEGPWITNINFVVNNEKKPFDDVRVRQALTLAIDRWGGSAALGKISLIKGVSGTFRPGASWSIPESELEKIPGYWRDIEKSRAEARRLLKEAGHENLKVRFLNRQLGQPFQPAGIYAVDQWRRVGIQAEHQELETKIYFDNLAKGDFDVAVNNISDFADDPSAQFNTLLSNKLSGVPYSRHSDDRLDELFIAQGREVDPAKRMAMVNEFEKRVLTQAYSFPLLWYQRIVANHKKVKGWHLQPSHFAGQTLVDVWLDQ
ncbi:MAG: ABC transporter substrate-binding protein [Hyphomicrobiaceae bacterium]